MADLLISPIFDLIFANLTSSAIDEIKLLWNVEDEVNCLSDTLSTIRAVLEDAEEQQITSRAVKDWLRKLKDVAYDADDILDGYATQAAQVKIEKVQPESSSRSKQVNKFFTCCFLANKLVIKHEMGSKMNEIRERLDKIESDRRFHLNTSSQGRMVEKIDRPKTSSFVHVSDVIGRDDDKKQILQILMSDESNHGNNISVLPIIGMGGQGKTTLAQLVYNDKQLQNLFEVRAWVCVSDNFDALRITHEIIESVTKKHFESLAIEPSQQCLLELLGGKRFLIILDDVWNEDPFDWEKLSHPFFGGARGSKIIVTTRIEKVAQIMGTIPPHRIKRLSEDDSWSLFVRKVFGDDHLDSVQGTLVDIGKKIVGRCGGLPLAIKSLGGMLSTKREESVWKNVLESKIWELPKNNNHILPALRLSYHHLSSNLKQCFSYCSIFPKDYTFHKEELVKLWMGEGYIQSKAGMDMEEVGEELFDDLLARSFFSLLSTKDDTTACNMHDLIHDLAEFVSQEDCLRIDACELIEAPKDVRHLGFIRSRKNIDRQMKLDDLYACKSLQRIRTFIQTKLTWDDALVQLGDSFDKFRCLRVLSLNGSKMKEIPSSIDNFKHLRYLDLSNNPFERLPNSICSLYTLQTLILSRCDDLIELPKGTMDLINLRHLQLDDCYKLTCSPPKMGKLTQLRDLSKFIVGGDGSECTILELKHLVNLGGKIEISSLENVATREEAEEADLKSKKHLEGLTLKWNVDREIFDISGQEEEVLEGLQPHINLKELTIEGYMGACLPSWLLPSLRTLKVIRCPKLKRLPLHLSPELSELKVYSCIELVDDLMRFPSLESLTLGEVNVSLLKSVPYLTSLEILNIWNDDEVESLDIQNLLCLCYLELTSCSKLSRFYPPANLTLLSMHDCPNLEALPLDLHNLSSLNSMYLVDCPKVASLPEKGLPASLTELRVDGCPLLIERCEKEKGEDWHKISHIRSLRINGRGYVYDGRSLTHVHKWTLVSYLAE